jgi:LDH2 family malate/lactate/ureidoglycolate dehydrogenase
MDSDQMDLLIEETLQFNAMINPEARYPGERSLREGIKNRKEGLEIPEEIWNEISGL